MYQLYQIQLYQSRMEIHVFLLQCMMGGHWFNEYFGPVNKVDWSSLVSVAVSESKQILKFKKDPIRHTVRVHQVSDHR